jgi:acid stress chaperone HdeB
MKPRYVLLGLLPALAVATPAPAQVTVDITKITCRQFIAGTMVPTKSIALWFSGYYNGKAGNTQIDLAQLRPNAEKVEDYCALHQDETVVNAVAAALGIGK